MSDLTQVDLNNLDIVEEESIEGFNPEAEFYTTPNPPDDGVHLAVLSISDRKAGVFSGTGKDGKPYFMIFPRAQIVEPGTRNDNLYVSDVASTMVMPNGSCKVAAILKALGQESIPRGAGAMIKALHNLLLGNPQVKITTRWEAQPRDPGADGKRRKPIIKGQNRFPPKPDGTHNPIVKDPETGEEVSAQAVVTKYQPVIPF